MKYFTKEWSLGRFNDKKSEKAANDYIRYIDGIYNRLSPTLKLLAKNISLHDGIFKFVLLDRKNNVLEIEGVFGDLLFSYYNLNLKYNILESIKLINLNEMFSGNKMEILNDEIEIISDEKFSHKFLFDTYQELEILFTDVEMKIKNESSKNFKHQKCQFKEVS
jgi:hypothetical protein